LIQILDIIFSARGIGSWSAMQKCAVLALVLQTAYGLRKSSKQAAATRSIAGVPLYAADASAAIADTYMVVFKDKVTDAALQAFCDEAKTCLDVGHPEEGGLPMVTMRGSEATLSASVAAHSSEIAFLEQDTEAEDDIEASEEGDEMEVEGSASGHWGLTAIGATAAQRAGNTGKGVNVYVMDSGVRVSHVEFQGRAIPTLDAYSRPPKVCSSSSTTCAADNRGHGTHVAGTVGSKNYGVAPAATIRAMNRGSSMSDGYSSIDWLVQNRQRPAVLTMSFSIGENSAVGKAAVDAAVAVGITVMTSGGNNRYDACRRTFAYIPNAIAVGSTTSSNTRSSFSNFGSCIDMMAPGSSILSSDWGSDTKLSTKSGTSMATPMTAGAAAMYLEKNPSASPAKVRSALKSAALKGAIGDLKGSADLFLQVA